MQPHDFISVSFPDATDTYYAEVKQVYIDGSFDCRFVHTGSLYTFKGNQDQLEVIKSTGKFKPGTLTTAANFFEPVTKWTDYPGGLAGVTFDDGLSYLGIVESYTPAFKVKFLHSGNSYTFDSKGMAYTEGGAYNGHTTQAIRPYITVVFSTQSSSSIPAAPVPTVPNESENEKDTAIYHINAFRSASRATWPYLDRSQVADRLIELIEDPDAVEQNSLPLCGPAAFITIYARYNPIDFALFSIGLCNDGMGAINHLLIEPNEELKKANYAVILKNDPSTPAMADWMVLSSLADTNNHAVDFKGTSDEEFAGFTYPESLAGWLEQVGRFTGVENNTNLISRMSYQEVLEKSRSGNPIILLINASMLNRGEVKGFPPNHYIVLKSPITQNGNDLEFDYWSWARTEHLKIWSLDFDNSFFGYVMATI